VAATDPLLDLTDAIVAALADGTFSSAFAVQWKDDGLAALEDAELLTTQVWAVDTAESLLPAYESTSSGHGVPVEEFKVLLVIQRKFAEGEDKPAACRELSALAAEITRFCRATAIEDAVCVKTVRDRKSVV